MLVVCRVLAEPLERCWQGSAHGRAAQDKPAAAQAPLGHQGLFSHLLCPLRPQVAGMCPQLPGLLVTSGAIPEPGSCCCLDERAPGSSLTSSLKQQQLQALNPAQCGSGEGFALKNRAAKWATEQGKERPGRSQG